MINGHKMPVYGHHKIKNVLRNVPICLVTMTSAKYAPVSLFSKISRSTVLNTNILNNKNVVTIFALFMLGCLLLYVSYNSNQNHIQFVSQTSHQISNTNDLDTEWICMETIFSSNFSHCLAKEFYDILKSNENLIVFEPYLLKSTLFRNGLKQNMTLPEVDADWQDLRWRFNLPAEFNWSRHSLTVAVFADKVGDIEKMNWRQFVEIERVYGANGPFDESNVNKTLLHLFYKREKYNPQGSSLVLHVVILHSVKHFLWIGSITNETQAKLGRSAVQHFGKHEQIFDLFQAVSIDGIKYPNDISHFLSEIPTSRYLHCPPQRQQWMDDNNLKINYPKVRASEFGFKQMKQLMRKLRMEFWLACGTLLGWYRQCHITPYTSDTDFDTWSKYLQGQDISPQFLKEAPKSSLRLIQKFGEPTKTQEFTLYSDQYRERYDLFFIFSNETNYLLPFHVPSHHLYAYSVYPKYSLCSGELLGYKLLSPCDPESVVVSEYGSEWAKPVNRWDYAKSPHNVGPIMHYNFSVPQFTKF